MKQQTRPKLVVGVGASAGGLEAFKQLLAALPGDNGMTFLLVQHLDPTHKSLLAELLTPLTPMVVRDADQGTVLEPNTVYIIRPDTALAVRDGKIALSSPTLHRGVRLPVDQLFRSLAKEYGPRYNSAASRRQPSSVASTRAYAAMRQMCTPVSLSL